MYESILGLGAAAAGGGSAAGTAAGAGAGAGTAAGAAGAAGAGGSALSMIPAATYGALPVAGMGSGAEAALGGGQLATGSGAAGQTPKASSSLLNGSGAGAGSGAGGSNSTSQMAQQLMKMAQQGSRPGQAAPLNTGRPAGPATKPSVGQFLQMLQSQRQPGGR